VPGVAGGIRLHTRYNQVSREGSDKGGAGRGGGAEAKLVKNLGRNRHHLRFGDRGRTDGRPCRARNLADEVLGLRIPRKVAADPVVKGQIGEVVGKGARVHGRSEPPI
jgi:hypothetical protein